MIEAVALMLTLFTPVYGVIGAAAVIAFFLSLWSNRK